MRWTTTGLLCSPWLAPDGARDARASCPLPTSPAPAPSTVPDVLSAYVSGWYRRSNLHAAAPEGVRELVQVPGPGFGPHDHPTTMMCLAALDQLPSGRAIDVGCGSGLLTQAWVATKRGPVIGLDADSGAVAQARASMIASGRTDGWNIDHGRIEQLAPGLLATSIVLANLPPIAHAALMRRLASAPIAIVLCGTSRTDAADSIAHCRGLGMRVVHARRSGRYLCTTMVRA
jgi:ribosomal protein L11 methyltransferase